jgi:hypothetical protein
MQRSPAPASRNLEQFFEQELGVFAACQIALTDSSTERRSRRFLTFGTNLIFPSWGTPSGSAAPFSPDL